MAICFSASPDQLMKTLRLSSAMAKPYDEPNANRTIRIERRGTVGGCTYGQLMDSTWETRELPVLAAVVQLCDEDDWGQAEPNQIAERTGLDIADVKKAVYRLLGEQPPFFQVSDSTTFEGRDFTSVHSPTGHAQRTVGAWPTPDSLSERIIDALNEAAATEQDPETKSRLSHAADVGKGTLAGVLARVLTQGF